MSKKDYSGLTADEVTKQLGDLLEKKMDILRDKGKGTLRTLFAVAALWIPKDLQRAVLEKNGVQKIEAPVCYNYLPDIVAAVEARGSSAAEKIKRYDQFVRDCNEAAARIVALERKRPAPVAGLREWIHLIQARVTAAKDWAEPSVS